MAYRPPVQQTAYVVDSDGNPVLFVDGAIPVAIQSGGGSGGTASDFGQSFPGVGTAVGAIDSDGNMAGLNLDSGGNLKTVASVTVTPVESSTVSAAGPTTVGTSSVQLLAANGSRKRLILQNVGTTKMLILFGAGSASAGSYHLALPAGGTANDGSSQPYVDIMWTGAIQAISSAAGGSVLAEEFT